MENEEKKNNSAESETDSQPKKEADEKSAFEYEDIKRAEMLFQNGDYARARKEIAKILKESGDAKKREQAIKLKKNMGIDKGALITAAIIFLLLIWVAYKGIFSR